ncbi:glutamate racemase, partial [Pseudomonas sp. A-1]
GERELLAAGPAQPARFWSSGEPAALARVLPVLWGEAAAVERLED